MRLSDSLCSLFQPPRSNRIHSNPIALAFHFGDIVRGNTLNLIMPNCLGRGAIYILSSKSDWIIRKTENEAATERRVIVRERKVNTEGGQTNRICLGTSWQLFRSSRVVSEAHDEMKHAFINTQSNTISNRNLAWRPSLLRVHTTDARV